MLRFSGSSTIWIDVERHLRSRTDLRGSVVVDVPAGKGRTSSLLQELGAKVIPLDLFPEFFKVPGLECRASDLMGTLAVEDGAADMVICEEGIEHLPDQLHALREFNRVLKPGGSLIIMTPNYSHLRAKWSYFLTESELYNRLPPNELDSLWHSEGGRQYFGHAFLIGIQRLRTLAVVSGFDLARVMPSHVSWGSLLLGITYPLIAATTAYAYRRNMRKNDYIDEQERRKTYGEVARLNLHPSILFGKQIFVEFKKREAWMDVALKVRQTKKQRDGKAEPLAAAKI